MIEGLQPYCEVSFTCHSYQSPHTRTHSEIGTDIPKLDQETKGILAKTTKEAAK